MFGRIRKISLIALVTGIYSLITPIPSWAQTTIDVTTTADVVDGSDGVTSLREAFDQVDSGAGTTYVINLVGGETYPLSLGPLITEREGLDLTINGNGNGLGSAVVDGSANPSGSTGIFFFHNESEVTPDPIDITLNDLEITGSGVNDHDTLFSAVGVQGRHSNGDSLTVNRCYIHDNFAKFGPAINGITYEFITINDSTLSNNTADLSGGAYHSQSTNLAINNSTISGNSAPDGGGLFVGLNTKIRNSTIYDNQADNGGGILLYPTLPSNTLDIQNSILAGNTATNSGPNCYFDVLLPHDYDISSGYNVLGDLTGGCDPISNTTGDQNGVTDPMLGSLADNGGPTPTHAVLAGSPALENGDPNGCKDTDGVDFLYDQRGFGFPRVEDGDADGTATCDSGAYERTNPQTQIGNGIMELMDGIASLPADAFGNGNKQNATLNKLDAVEGQFAAILAEEDPAVKAQLIADLSNKLTHDLLAKGDGCGTEPDKNDWIVDCEAQEVYQAAIQELLDLLAEL